MFRLSTARLPLYKWLVWIVVSQSICIAQTRYGQIAGLVGDPSGAVVPGAIVSAVCSAGEPQTRVTDNRGAYSILGIVPGVCTITVTAKGFAAFRHEKVRVNVSPTVRLDIVLVIEVAQQQITVSDHDVGVDISPEKNASATVLEGNNLDLLADDAIELQAELQAMAGPALGSDTPEIYVDGFSTQKLPPKSSIHAIRINQNPYSAQYDRPGRGRAEIFTKPGTDAFHGGVEMAGNDSSFDSRNPFLREQPPYHSTQIDSNLGGPINKKASFFANAYWGDTQKNAVIDAETLDSSLNQIHFSKAIGNPDRNTGFGARFDFPLGADNSFTVRYQSARGKETNEGIGQFGLASQGYNTDNSDETLQVSDAQVYGSKLVNQTRFQYVRSRNTQEVQNATATTTVQGAFTGGASSVGNLHDKQDRYDLQDYFLKDNGKHFIKFGGRIRALREVNSSTANFNGNFVFSSLDAYQLTAQGIVRGLPAAQIRAEGGGPSQFNIVSGTPGISATMADAGVYAEDDWKARPNLTLSYGLRFETQNHISNHIDVAPRIGIAWGIGNSKKGPQKTVLRAGYGWFYSRFASSYVLQAERQNGVNQTEFIANAPDFYPNVPSLNMLEAQSAKTIYRISSNLRSPYVIQTGISLDRQLSKGVTVSLGYINARGMHQLFSRNTNAPLPGTYNPAQPMSGLRPLGGNQNIYQYTSEGILKQNQLILNANVRGGSRLNFFGYYVLNYADGNTSGAGSFPSNQYNITADYGRTAYDIRHRAVFTASLSLPYGLTVSPFITAASGTPVNIVVGEDLNGDNQFNDRPAFATDLNRTSVIRTKWGTFDTNPMTRQKIIPINYGSAPALVNVNLRVGKVFMFGKEGDHQISANTGRNGKADRYKLTFNVSAQNALNKVNLAPPVAVLGSPLFGKSNALAGSSMANRTILLEMQFTF
jgi:hypothetical protein